MRADLAVAERFGLSRTKAQQLLARGAVTYEGRPLGKPAEQIDDLAALELTERFRFASLGGEKLAKAFEVFPLDVTNRVCADIGASNGGFTDCLLQHGARKVYCVDVGACALADFLRADARVTVMDETNARYLSAASFDDTVDFVCADVSFISLKLILPAIYAALRDGGECVALIKPQFEAGASHLSKRGIVADGRVRERVVTDIRSFAEALGFLVAGVDTAHVRAGKNVEFLLYLKKCIE